MIAESPIGQSGRSGTDGIIAQTANVARRIGSNRHAATLGPSLCKPKIPGHIRPFQEQTARRVTAFDPLQCHHGCTIATVLARCGSRAAASGRARAANGTGGPPGGGGARPWRPGGRRGDWNRSQAVAASVRAARTIPLRPMVVPPAATACHECAEVPGTQQAVVNPAVGTTHETSPTSVEPVPTWPAAIGDTRRGSPAAAAASRRASCGSPRRIRPRARRTAGR